jgi:hypothetical protein
LDETSPEIIQKAVAEGPGAFEGLCFQWAAEVARTEEVEKKLRSHDSLPPSLAYMKAVCTLSAAIE